MEWILFLRDAGPPAVAVAFDTPREATAHARPSSNAGACCSRAAVRNATALQAQFDAGLFPGWDAVEADGLERARFMLQMEPCDVLVLDADLYRTAATDALSWLGGPDQTPVLFLADVTPGLVVEALSQGADHWLPRDLALSCPALLAATLQTAAHLADLRRRARRAGETLADCRRQVSRLVSLLWEATPAEGRHGWFNQRHMLERLDEEVARTRRHGGAFTVVLGEVRGGRREQDFGGRDAPPGDVDRGAGDAGQAPLRRGGAVRAARLHAAAAGGDGRWARSAAAGGCKRCWRSRRPLEETPLPPVQACFGAAPSRRSSATVKALLRQAEERLDRAKSGVGERVEV